MQKPKEWTSTIQRVAYLRGCCCCCCGDYDGDDADDADADAADDADDAGADDDDDDDAFFGLTCVSYYIRKYAYPIIYIFVTFL